MAGDWIAMRHDLWECPQVVRILSAMCPQDVRNMSARLRIIGALYRTWCLFDRHTEDGILHGYTAEILDEEIGWSGWAENLQHVGWLVINEQSLTAPEFSEYFGNSARRRMKDTRRKRESRKTCPQNVRTTADKMRTTGQDNTRQKSNKKTPLPPSLPENIDTPEFASAWHDWQSHRQQIKKPLTPGQIAEQLSTFSEWGESRAIAAIRHTIFKGWQGIREPEPSNNGQPHKKTNKEYIEEALRKAAELEKERANANGL